MDLIIILAALVLIGWALHKWMPDGWLTNFWAIVGTYFSTVMAGAPDVLQYLVGVDWKTLVSPEVAPYVAVGIGVLLIMARMRSRMKGN